MKCLVCRPYLIHIVAGFIDLHLAKSLEVHIKFVYNKYPTLSEWDITTLIVPLLAGNIESCTF